MADEETPGTVDEVVAWLDVEEGAGVAELIGVVWAAAVLLVVVLLVADAAEDVTAGVDDARVLAAADSLGLTSPWTLQKSEVR